MAMISNSSCIWATGDVNTANFLTNTKLPSTYQVIPLMFVILKSASCSTVMDLSSQQSPLVAYYCAKTEYCEEGTHVMCMYHNQIKKTGPSCSSYINTIMTSEMVDQILDIVNNIRSKVATGQETGFKGHLLPRAYGMMRMQWDHELAIFAQALADQCFGGREDKCRATSKFPDPSQSSGIVQFKFPFWEFLTTDHNGLMPQGEGLTSEKLAFAIDKFFKATYALKKTVSTEMVLKCPPTKDLPDNKSRHYLNLLRGSATHIGCGISAYTRHHIISNAKQSVYNVLEIVCNFSESPQPEKPLYTPTPPIPGTNFTTECGCPEGYKESSGCLCEESRYITWPVLPPKLKEINKESHPSRKELMPRNVQSWTQLQTQLQSKREPQINSEKKIIHLPSPTNAEALQNVTVEMLRGPQLNSMNNQTGVTADAKEQVSSTSKKPQNTNPHIYYPESYNASRPTLSADRIAYDDKEKPKFMSILDTLANEVKTYQFDHDNKQYFNNRMKNIYKIVQHKFKNMKTPRIFRNAEENGYALRNFKRKPHFRGFRLRNLSDYIENLTEAKSNQSSSSEYSDEEDEYFNESECSSDNNTIGDTLTKNKRYHLNNYNDQYNHDLINYYNKTYNDTFYHKDSDNINYQYDKNYTREHNNTPTSTNQDPLIVNEYKNLHDSREIISSSEDSSRSVYGNIHIHDLFHVNNYANTHANYDNYSDVNNDASYHADNHSNDDVNNDNNEGDTISLRRLDYKRNYDNESDRENRLPLDVNKDFGGIKRRSLSYFDSARRRAQTNRVYRQILENKYLHPLEHMIRQQEDDSV